MHKIKLMVFVVAMALFGAATSYAGEKSVGLRGGYVVKNSAATAGLFFKYSFTESIRLSTTLDYYFQHRGKDAYSLNANAEFPFRLITDRLRLYPLVGVGLTSWNQTFKSVGEGLEDDDSSSRTTRFGLNVGAGADFYVTKTLKLGVECKYGWIKHYSTDVFTLSIGYVF